MRLRKGGRAEGLRDGTVHCRGIADAITDPGIAADSYGNFDCVPLRSLNSLHNATVIRAAGDYLRRLLSWRCEAALRSVKFAEYFHEHKFVSFIMNWEAISLPTSKFLVLQGFAMQREENYKVRINI